MAWTYKTRKRLTVLILVLGLPLYVVAAVTIMNMLERPSLWVELAVYISLGVLWALPFKFIFVGTGKADPDEEI